MAEQQTATCPHCSRMLSPEDTIVFGYGLLGHLNCRRPRVLSAEECTLLFIYCRDHQVAECVRCTGKFRLGEVASLDPFGIRSHGCPWCHTDLTDSIRAHLYGCAMLPAEVRRRAQTAREATRSLVQSLQVRGTADGLVRQAEASLHALRETMRQAPTLSATSETKQQEGRSDFCPTTSSLCTSRSETASPTTPASGKSPADRTRQQAARVSTLAFGELINPPRCRIGRGALTSASG